MGLFSAIAGAFDESGPAESTLMDIEKFQRNLHRGALLGDARGAHHANQQSIVLKPGTVFVHNRRPNDPLPPVPVPPKCGVPALDAEYRRRSEQLMQVAAMLPPAMLPPATV